MNELKYNPLDVQKLLFKDKENVSIEEMDYMMDLAIKYQQIHEEWFKCIENKYPTTFFLRKCKEVFEGVKPEYRKAMK